MSAGQHIARTVVVLLWSMIVWTALWLELTVANLVSGAVVGLVTLALVPAGVGSDRIRIRPLAVLRLAGYFSWALVRASAVVAWEVVTPRNRIHEGIVAVPMRTSSRGLITLIANAVSLTPGTVTLEVHEAPPTLYVHILHLRTIEDVREDIQHLETLALNAFPQGRPVPTPEAPDGAIDALARDTAAPDGARRDAARPAEPGRRKPR